MYNHLNYLTGSRNKLYTSAAAALPSAQELELEREIAYLRGLQGLIAKRKLEISEYKRILADPIFSGTLGDRNYYERLLKDAQVSLVNYYLLLWPARAGVSRLYNRLRSAQV